MKLQSQDGTPPICSVWVNWLQLDLRLCVPHFIIRCIVLMSAFHVMSTFFQQVRTLYQSGLQGLLVTEISHIFSDDKY